MSSIQAPTSRARELKHRIDIASITAEADTLEWISGLSDILGSRKKDLTLYDRLNPHSKLYKSLSLRRLRRYSAMLTKHYDETLLTRLEFRKIKQDLPEAKVKGDRLAAWSIERLME